MAVSITEKIDNVWGDKVFVVEDHSVRKISYEVAKADRQFGLYSIKPSRGPVIKFLQGKYTNPHTAINKVKTFLEKERQNANKSRTETESNIQ